MSRRGGKGELGFGSDSFLDIIANIVGILIILIVVAGMRVSNAPISLPAVAAVDETAAARAPVPPAESTAPVVAGNRDREEIDLEPLTAVAAQPVAGPSPELVRRARDLEAEIAAIDAEAAAHAVDLEELAAQQQAVERKTESAVRTLTAQSDVLRSNTRSVEEFRSTLQESQARLAALQKELQEKNRQQSPVEQIKHKLTPVSRMVHGKELHFRVAENRVAHIPILELITRLRRQVGRQKDWLVKFHRHEGRLGPVKGFSMTYVVERQRPSVIEEMRFGQATMRISVTRWQIDPAPDLESEPIEVAVRPGSAFHLALQLADPDTTLTFWVYPDSFAGYRQLQTFAHALGFTVAARPLPFGVPIAGSPQGTRSAGQ